MSECQLFIVTKNHKSTGLLCLDVVFSDTLGQDNMRRKIFSTKELSIFQDGTFVFVDIVKRRSYWVFGSVYGDPPI